MQSTEFGNEAMSRTESRKRRRVSERRRVFSRMGASQWAGERRRQVDGGGSLSTPDHSSLSSSTTHPPMEVVTVGSRSDSPSLMADSSSIAMKIQFHITVAPDNEPLILAEDIVVGTSKRKGSVGEQIQERLLQRQRSSSSSTRRRHQLMALHKQPALETGVLSEQVHSDTNLGSKPQQTDPDDPLDAIQHQRSSTITGDLTDEDTRRFLERHQQRPGLESPLAQSRATSGGSPVCREHIFFKRDGQRFGHEFTLKLAVEKTYRCLLKVRPLMPLASITVQGQQVQFADCSQHSSTSPTSPNHPHSAPASSSTLNRCSWQDVRARGGGVGATEHHLGRALTSHELRQGSTQNQSSYQRISSAVHFKSHQPYHDGAYIRHLIQREQHQQMLRHFHHLTTSSASNSHLGSQLVYMFDWSATRFEANKNKNRTQLQTVLRFKNGQVLVLPLQVKFYQSECRQHLSWGSQLHFIDYDCQVDQLGQISLNHVQYY